MFCCCCFCMAGQWFPLCTCSASCSPRQPQPTRALPSLTSSAAPQPSSRSPSWPYLVRNARPQSTHSECFSFLAKTCIHTARVLVFQSWICKTSPISWIKYSWSSRITAWACPSVSSTRTTRSSPSAPPAILHNTSASSTVSDRFYFCCTVHPRPQWIVQNPTSWMDGWMDG